ncbi:MAG: D-alanyl-D-alanine carboxypeptidase [Clostridia bacterium]|nr:D-alanyl-D-alanine carboxypeptidase [Clostridia bacterium]
MKKSLFILLAVVVVTIAALPIGATAFADDSFVGTYPSRSAYLVDYDTGTVLIDKNSDERYPIASIVKIMTLLLTFEEIDQGRLSLEEKITVSVEASGMGGSQMFLDAGKEYPVTDLIKGVAVCSANDAAVALGERIAGSIDGFVQKMNEYAKEIGMENTLFCNATGLPNSGEQYSTAKDVSKMFGKLLRHEKYFDYAGIWMEDYRHPDGRVTEMVNTNKLIRFYKDCDAGKTGFTNDAMFCLAASAKRDDMRVVGVVLGSETSKDRFREMTDMFKYAFANYEIRTIFRKGETVQTDLKVDRAKDDNIPVCVAEDIKFFIRKGLKQELSTIVTINEDLSAPISKGQAIGRVKIVDANGEVIAETDLLSVTNVERRGYGDALDKVLSDWIRS